jgi:pyruvate kinase
LGRLEDNVLISIEQVLKHFGYNAIENRNLTKISYDDAQSVLLNRSKLLLGTSPNIRNTRIMVTLDIDSAYDSQLLEDLLKNGMDIARINCAYSKSEEWKIIIDAVRNAESRLYQREQGSERKCLIVMDLAGPKIRIGKMKAESRPLKIAVPKDINGKPLKMVEGYLDCYAKYTEKIHLPRNNTSFIISISNRNEKLTNANIAEKIFFLDFRRRLCSMRILERISENKVRVGIDKTVHLQKGIKLHRKRNRDDISLFDDKNTLNVDNDNKKSGSEEFVIGSIRPRHAEIKVKTGDKLLIYKKNIQGGLINENDTAVISCTMPEILEKAHIGHRALIDDGKISSIVNSVNDEYLELKITFRQTQLVKSNQIRG